MPNRGYPHSVLTSERYDKKQRFSSIITCIGCLLILLISACGDDIDDDNNNTDDDDYNNDYDDPDHFIIEQPVFEKMLAEAVGKVPGEEITPDELATLTHLTFPPPRDLGPSFGRQSIELLAHCINLKELDLYGYGIVDFSPLAGLTRLERLYHWLNCCATKTKSRVLTTPSPLGSGADLPNPLAT